MRFICCGGYTCKTVQRYRLYSIAPRRLYGAKAKPARSSLSWGVRAGLAWWARRGRLLALSELLVEEEQGCTLSQAQAIDKVGGGSLFLYLLADVLHEEVLGGQVLLCSR